MVQGAEGADPPAEPPTEDQGDRQGDEGQQQGGSHGMAPEPDGDHHQGVEVEKEGEQAACFVFRAVGRRQEQIEKQQQEDCLG